MIATAWITSAVTNRGLLVWIENTTPPHDLATEHYRGTAHGVIPTVRCHYLTALGVFSFKTSTGFGAEQCEPIKRRDPSLWRFKSSGPASA